MIYSEEPYGRNDPYARQREIFPRLSPEMEAALCTDQKAAAIDEYIASCGTD